MPFSCRKNASETLSAATLPETVDPSLLLATATFVSRPYGADCLDAIVEFATRTLDVDYAHIALLEPGRDAARIVAVRADGQPQPSGHAYALAGTPCANVFHGSYACHGDGVAARFPHDDDLKTLQAVAYVGEPMRNSDGVAIGLIALVKRTPMSCSPTLEACLRLLAARASAEVAYQQNEAALRESEARYRVLFENAGDGVFVTRTGRILDVNAAAERIFRCARSEMIGRTVADFSPSRQADGRPSAEAALERIERALAGHEPPFEWRHCRVDGSVFDAEITLAQATIDGVPHIVANIRDITERKQTEAKIEFLAHHDVLTGLPNRVLLRDRFVLACARAERSGTQAALLFIDLDNFKAINDSLGHAIGDDLLLAVVNRLDHCVRDTDTVSRQGGDEFIVLLNDISDIGAVERVAGEILLQLAEPFHIDGHILNSGASIGVAIFPTDGDDFDTLLQRADTAMYTAKAAGRNTCRFFDAAMNARAKEHMLLQSRLHQALPRRHLWLAYQPKFDIDGGRLTGIEALLRWRDPVLGEIMPGRFIPVAEDCGLIIAIGQWVIQAACRQIATWRAAGFVVPPVSVNLSALQFRRKGLVDTVRQALEQYALPPALLELELTESILLHNVDSALETMRQLKALGIGLSIDDFGTGYSSLAYLKRFAVDKLKIDQSFVRDIDTDPDDAAIVHTVVQLARGLRLGIIAEGVETVSQLAFLRTAGCEEVQGYLFGRPQPADEIAALLPRLSPGSTDETEITD